MIIQYVLFFFFFFFKKGKGKGGKNKHTYRKQNMNREPKRFMVQKTCYHRPLFPPLPSLFP